MALDQTDISKTENKKERKYDLSKLEKWLEDYEKWYEDNYQGDSETAGENPSTPPPPPPGGN